MPALVVYINGWPGVGKLTVARALQPHLSGSKILHNHELIDPVERQYGRKHPLYQQKRGEYRRERLETVTTDMETVYIFTDSQTEHNECMGDYTNLALEGRRFYSVILTCDQAENERRLVAEGRGGDANGKLTDLVILTEYRERGSGIFKFGDDDEIELDVTASTHTTIKMPNFMDIPAELRVQVYEYVVADIDRYDYNDLEIILRSDGKPIAHPLARASHQLHNEFASIYQTHVLKHAKVIRAVVFNLNFAPIYHVLEIPRTDMSVYRNIIVQIKITQDQVAGDEVAAWYEHCASNVENAKVHSDREYRVRFSGKGSLTSGSTNALRAAYGKGYDGRRLCSAVQHGVEELYARENPKGKMVRRRFRSSF
ncbi:hypothetical protein LTR10_009438 [Elasticomyces elasticus]|nr:hypothetical protein LTR10_009438 [Elasticomyces elasticus]